MDLSVIIVSFNTVGLLRDCIRGVKDKAGNLDLEIIVVDNCSKDGSVEMVRAEFPDVVLIANEKNTGFGAANNQGLNVAKGKYILLLNSDTIVHEGALNKLVDYLDKNADVKIVGPKLLNPDLTVQMQCKRGFPGFFNSVGHFSGLARIFPQNPYLGGYFSPMPNDITHEVDAVSGACMMINRDIIARAGGLFDEQFFMHFEDIDLCFRVKKLGFKVVYVHDSEVVHLKGQSSRIRALGVKKDFLESATMYFRKNYKTEFPIGYLVILLAVKIGLAFCLLRTLLVPTEELNSLGSEKNR